MLLPAAAAAEILIESRVGFHGVFQLGRPFPLEVSLENIGRPADGTLEIQVWKGGAIQGGVPYAVFHRREVFLPARSRRTVQLTVHPDVLSRPLKIRFTSATATASRELDLRRHFSSAPVVLSVSDGSPVPLTALGASLTNRVVTLTLTELPAEARAMLGVSHLVIYDQSLRDLSRAQVRALDDWLATGGRMVIIGSLNFTLYQEPQLARYLPVRVTGVKRTAFATHGEAGESKIVAGVWAQTAVVSRGRVLTEAEGLPVLVEHDWGRGKITYLALDAGRPPLSMWNGLPRFLQSLLTPGADESRSSPPQWSPSIFSQVLLSPSFISTYIPNRSLFFAILGYTAGLVVLARLWQRGRVARRTLVLSCCGWILCAAAAGYLFFGRGGRAPDGVLLAATVMESAGDGYVEARSNVALFSTQLREYGLAFGRGWVDAMPLAAAASAQPAPSLVYQHGAGTTRVQLALEAWSFKLLRARHVEALRLSAVVERQADRLVLEVENRSGKELTDCWLLAPGTRVALGNLPAGERWKKAFELSAAPGDRGGNSRAWAIEEESLRKITFNDKSRDVLFHASFFPPDGTQALRRNAALFFCWVRDPDLPFEIGDPRVRVHNYALYRVIVTLAGADEE
ncbi:MAG TPA: hypothetical protein VED01_20755 [Burkholderiales bacterium]|nr:hypothetical protein [Burkholderiales bacterium]